MKNDVPSESFGEQLQAPPAPDHLSTPMMLPPARFLRTSTINHQLSSIPQITIFYDWTAFVPPCLLQFPPKMNLNYKQRPELSEKEEPPQADSVRTVGIQPPSTIHHPPLVAPEPGACGTFNIVQSVTCNLQPATCNSALPPPPLVAPKFAAGARPHAPT